MSFDDTDQDLPTNELPDWHDRDLSEWPAWNSVSQALDLIRLGEILRGIGIIFICCCFALIPLGQLLKIAGLVQCLRVPTRANAIPWVFASLVMESAVFVLFILAFIDGVNPDRLLPVLVGGMIAGQLMFFIFLHQVMLALHEKVMSRLVSSFAALWFLHILALIAKLKLIFQVNPQIGMIPQAPNMVLDFLQTVGFIVPILVHMSYHAMLKEVKEVIDDHPVDIPFDRWMLLVVGVALEWLVLWLQQ
jgi:hypothetical protein